jgi:hypothetical protein
MATPYFQVSRTAARALEEFSDEFRGALALTPVDTWAGDLGLVRTTDALKTTFPIPLDAAGYKEFKGDIKFRTLYSRSLSMKSKQWQDGVEAPVAEIEGPDFIDWAGQPAAMALEWTRLPNEIVATMLESGAGADGPLLDFYRDPDTNTAGTRQLFASDHPFNVLKTSLGTFDNDIDTTVAEIMSGTFFDTIEQYFGTMKGPNGKSMALSMQGGTFLVPTARTSLFKKALEFDTLITNVTNAGALNGTANVVSAVPQNNIYKGYKYRTAVELTQANVFYAIAAGKPGNHPWVVQVGSAPEEIVHDKSSELYKRHLKVGLAYVGQANSAACLPHRIVKVTITG